MQKFVKEGEILKHLKLIYSGEFGQKNLLERISEERSHEISLNFNESDFNCLDNISTTTLLKNSIVIKKKVPKTLSKS